MSRDLILSQLYAVRSTVEALIIEVEGAPKEQSPFRCCDTPALTKLETYNTVETTCANCNTTISVPSGPSPSQEGG